MLFGLIFFVPFLAWRRGGDGALSGKMADYGISDEFIKTTREKVTEGTSALFLMTSDAVLDKVTADAARRYEFELMFNLTKEQEEQP